MPPSKGQRTTPKARPAAATATKRGGQPAAAPAGPRWGVPTPFVVVSLVLCLAGVGISTYLTIAHYNTGVVLSCPNTGVINCAKVTSSAQSSLLGIPVALLGLLFYIGMTVLCLPQAWARQRLILVRLGAAATGILFVFYLVYAELFILDAICLWCTSVHVVTLLLFGTILFAAAIDPRRLE